MKRTELERRLQTLGKKFTLDILDLVHKEGPCTASEVADSLDIQVATAVKHLMALFEIGVLARVSRKGKTRSAYEYSLRSERIVIEIDVRNLGEEDFERRNASHMFLILIEVTRKLAAFTGKNEKKLIYSWTDSIEGHEILLGTLKITFEESPDEGFSYLIENLGGTKPTTEISSLLFSILNIYEEKFGKSSMKSLALTSAEAVSRRIEKDEAVEDIGELLPERYFEIEG